MPAPMAHWRQMASLRFWAMATLLPPLLALPALANRIYWYAPPATLNLTSDGTPLDARFQFELGVFRDGFVPNTANRSEWATYWSPAQRTPYVPTTASPPSDTGGFSGLFEVEDNAAPFLSGRPAWIWGFRYDPAGSEWILCRATSWTWPTPNPLNPNPIFWNASAATPLIGTIHSTTPDGTPVLLRTAKVNDAAGPATPWSQWQATELANEPLNGPHDDPDGDGTINLLEYVFGSPPKTPTPPPAMPLEAVTTETGTFLQIRIPRRKDHPANLTVETSPDLAIWNSGPTATTVIEDTPAAWVVRDTSPLTGPAPCRYLRVKIQLTTP